MELNFTLDGIDDAAKKFLSSTEKISVFALHGEMGAGKTTFIHALCEVIGVRDVVSSPTFSIINQYKTANDETVYHLDLYRLRDEQEAIHAGVEDCLCSGFRCFVEWPEKAAAIFPENTLHVTISVIGHNARKLGFNL
jgi:tRNA threonylcarbamoyladenosine biosynthesis protein TsaE